MIDKEQLAKDFVKAKGIVDYNLQVSYENMFKWGFEAGTTKWINSEDEKPSEDENVLCKRYNADIPEVVNYAVCRYYQGYWYGDLNGGDKIVQWQKIAE